MKAIVHLTKEGAIALRAHTISRYGSDKNLRWHGSLLAAKEAAQAAPLSEYENVEVRLPDWEGDLKERAAVALGWRKKSTRNIISVTPLE
jgi:hypothetical protein